MTAATAVAAVAVRYGASPASSNDSNPIQSSPALDMHTSYEARGGGGGDGGGDVGPRDCPQQGQHPTSTSAGGPTEQIGRRDPLRRRSPRAGQRGARSQGEAGACPMPSCRLVLQAGANVHARLQAPSFMCSSWPAPGTASVGKANQSVVLSLPWARVCLRISPGTAGKSGIRSHRAGPRRHPHVSSPAYPDQPDCLKVEPVAKNVAAPTTLASTPLRQHHSRRPGAVGNILP